MRRIVVAGITAALAVCFAITALIASRNYHHDLSQHFNAGFCNYLQVTQAVERCRVQNLQNYLDAQNWLHAEQVAKSLGAIFTTVTVVLVALILTRRPLSVRGGDTAAHVAAEQRPAIG